MSEPGKPKLSDAIPHHDPKTSGHPEPAHDQVAEQAREQAEHQKAKEAEASIRDRMVDIGRGNQQAGRQGQ